MAHSLQCTFNMKACPIIIMLFVLGCGAIPEQPFLHTPQSPQPEQTPPPKGLQITVLDVGEGDATLISTPNGYHMLIDAGPPASGKSVTLPYLLNQNITQLNHVFTSHYDSDHIGGLPEILAGTDAMRGTADDIMVSGFCWDRGDSAAKHTTAFASYTSTTKSCERTAIPGDQITFDDGVSLEVMAVNGLARSGPLATLEPEDENGASMVLRVRYGEFTYLTTGDLPGGGGNPPYDTIDEETPLASQIGHVDVLHLGHHGSHTASNVNFLQTLSPRAAIISVGNGNTYYHPHPSVLQRLAQLKIPVYQTESGHADGTEQSHVMDGNVVIESDGNGFEVRTD